MASTPQFIEAVSTSNQATGLNTRELSPSAFHRIEGASTVIARRMPTDALYDDWRNASPIVHRAVELIDKAIDLLRTAVRELANDPIASDDAINQTTPVLTELFCCRQIGEGFATVVNGLLCAVQNNGPNRWQANQLQTTLAELSRLRTEPFLKFDQAIETIERLGLTVSSLNHNASTILVTG